MTIKQAVRTLNRIINGPTGAAMARDEECDAYFDGGEWSGPAHARMWEEWVNDMVCEVAAAYGLANDTLERAFEHARHEENNRYMDAIYARRGQPPRPWER